MKILTVVSLLIAPAFTVTVKERLQVASRQDVEYPYEMEGDGVNNDLPYEVVDDGVGDHEEWEYGVDEPMDDYYYPDGGVGTHNYEIPSTPPEEPKPVKCLEIHYVYLPGEKGPTGPPGDKGEDGQDGAPGEEGDVGI